MHRTARGSPHTVDSHSVYNVELLRRSMRRSFPTCAHPRNPDPPDLDTSRVPPPSGSRAAVTMPDAHAGACTPRQLVPRASERSSHPSPPHYLINYLIMAPRGITQRAA